MRTLLVRRLAVIFVVFVLVCPVAWAELRTEELRVESVGGVSLAGTLHLPEGEGPFPAVIMTHGSEAGRRAMQGYVRWARDFNSHGVAALIFDKRGVGDSTGTYVEAPDLAIPAEDVLAWVDKLKSREDLRSDRIGVFGWSQGGWVGPLAASMTDDLSFVVSISGPGVSPLEQNIYDKTNRIRREGASPEQAAEFSRVIRLVWTYLVTGKGRRKAQKAWDSVKDETWFSEGYTGPPMMDRDTVLKDPRMQSYVAHSSYEPVPTLEKLTVPMLAVFGGADPVVPVEASIEAMQGAFRKSGNTEFTYKIYDGADHGVRVGNSDNRRKPADGFTRFVVDWVVEQAD